MIIKITLGDVCFFLLHYLSFSFSLPQILLPFRLYGFFFLISSRRLKSMSDKNVFLNYSKSIVGTMNEAMKSVRLNILNEMSTQRKNPRSVL